MKKEESLSPRGDVGKQRMFQNLLQKHLGCYVRINPKSVWVNYGGGAGGYYTTEYLGEGELLEVGTTGILMSPEGKISITFVSFQAINHIQIEPEWYRCSRCESVYLNTPSSPHKVCLRCSRKEEKEKEKALRNLNKSKNPSFCKALFQRLFI